MNDRLKTLKINKNQLTIRPRSKEEIKEFQKQELERYKKPHLPWRFINPDKSFSIVAPVVKKIPNSNQSKPRDHALLMSDRPSYVTILCLSRDAAARLPEGVGTRADICDLLKDSQYTNEKLSDSQINNIVSGALDRLHYEKDPCVKYDLQKKLWIYLHKNRNLDYEPWNEHLKKNNLSYDGVSILKNNESEEKLNANENEYSNFEENVSSVNFKDSNNEMYLDKEIMDSSQLDKISEKNLKNHNENLITIKNEFDMSGIDLKLNENDYVNENYSNIELNSNKKDDSKRKKRKNNNINMLRNKRKNNSPK